MDRQHTNEELPDRSCPQPPAKCAPQTMVPPPAPVPRPRHRLPHFHLLRDIFALIGLGFVIVEIIRYAVIPLLILLNPTH